MFICHSIKLLVEYCRQNEGRERHFQSLNFPSYPVLCHLISSCRIFFFSFHYGSCWMGLAFRNRMGLHRDKMFVILKSILLVLQMCFFLLQILTHVNKLLSLLMAAKLSPACKKRFCHHVTALKTCRPRIYSFPLFI